MPDQYLYRISSHIKDTFNDASFEFSKHYGKVKIENLNKDFVLHIEDNKMDETDSFGFVKLKTPIKTSQLDYFQLIQFASLMNHCHRGCHWAIDTQSYETDQLYIYSTLTTELGRRNDDKDQMIMEILNLQKMKFQTDQYLESFLKDSTWLNQFNLTNSNKVIPCMAPENFINPQKQDELYSEFLFRLQNLECKLQQINGASFKLTTSQNTDAIITFLGEELVSLYSVVTEENETLLNLKNILNERNHELLIGHFEASPVKNIVGFTNYLRLTHGLRDVKLRLFMNSPDIAKLIYSEFKGFKDLKVA